MACGYVTICNYRCFGDPGVTLPIEPGFTALVGINNSGKSSVLRALRDFRGHLSLMANPAAWVPSKAHPNVGVALNCAPAAASELFRGPENKSIRISIVPGDSDSPQERRVEELSLEYGYSGECAIRAFRGGRRLYPLTGWEPSKHRLEFEGGVCSSREACEMASILANSTYIPAGRHAIGSLAGGAHFDCTSGSHFVREWSHLRSHPTDRSIRDRMVRVEADVARLFDFPGLSVAASTPNADDLVFTIGTRTYRVTELGSGVGQVFHVLASVAIKRPALVLIDEPEVGLHPALQCEFLTMLGSYASFGIVFATHQHGLAHAVADRIFAVSRDAASEISRVTRVDDIWSIEEMLGGLQYPGMRLAGCEGVLLVEGPTDVRVFLEWLMRLRAGHRWAVVHGGGTSTISAGGEEQMKQLKRLAGSVVAVVDSERESGEAPPRADRVAFQDICQRLGIRCHISAKRATENYFPRSAIQAVCGHARELSPYEPLDPKGSWNKRDNWRIAREMSREQILDNDIGDFLQSVLEARRVAALGTAR